MNFLTNCVKLNHCRRFFMSKITTEDCKLFLLDLYKDKKVTEWKRIRKFKDENGDSCRDFSHSDGTSLTLIERNGHLSVLPLAVLTSFIENDKPPVSSTKNVKSKGVSILPLVAENDTNLTKKAYFTIFDETQLKSAKRLVNAFAKPKEDPITPNSDAKGFDAIPNLIYFSFLEDANCDEIEYLETIAKDMNFNALMNDIVVFFIPSTVSSMCEHLSPLIEPLLPVPLQEVEEMSFTLNDRTLTVTDVFEQLIKAGFVYNPEGCALKSLFTQYQLIAIDPVINPNDKTAEYKKNFLSALKKDDVNKMKALIDSGMPLTFKVGGQSLLGKTMYEHKIECFKYLSSLYPNTANIGNGIADEVWEHVWWKTDCSSYFMANCYYDFTHSNKNAHRNLVSTLVHHTTYFDKVKHNVNPEFFAVSCLECTLTHDRAYDLFKEFVKKAIDEYPEVVSSNKQLADDLVHGFIIPPVLELLAGSSCTFKGKTVFEVVQAKIDEIGHDPKGYINKINYYKAFLRKYGR